MTKPRRCKQRTDPPTRTDKLLLETLSVEELNPFATKASMSGLAHLSACLAS